jgi:integrase
MSEDRVIQFDGAYTELFKGYVAYKCAMGYAIPISYQYTLRDISSFLATRPSVPEIVSRQYAEEYAAKRDTESISTQCKRTTILRQFCKYLASMGYLSHILPDGLARAPHDFTPYIISEEEMSRVIAAADTTAKGNLPLFIRMLWCCGLRIGEAINLDVGDIDLNDATVLVRKAKGDRTRLLPMSKSLTAYIAEHRPDIVSHAAPVETVFLPSATGLRRNKGNTGVEVKAVMLAAGVTIDGKRAPRPHDIRHSYAVHVLEKMDDDGVDIYVALPLLAIYMGHADIQSTEYYLRLTKASRQRIEDALTPVSDAVFGGDCDE